MFTKLSKIILPIFVALLIGATPLLWFHGDIITSEEFYALDYGMWGKIYTQGWAPNVNYGEFSLFLPFKLQYLFFHVLEYFGIAYYYALVAWHTLSWTFTALFFYIFIKEVFKEKLTPLIATIAIIFYVFNPFFLNISVLLTPPRILFIFLPLIFTFIYKYFVTTGPQYKNLATLALITFFASPLYVNIPYGSIVYIVILLGIIYKQLVCDRNFKNLITHTLFFMTLSLLLNIWWIIPFVTKIKTNVDDIKGVTSTFITINASKVHDVLTYYGSWAFREKASETVYYFPYYKSYDTLPLVLLRYIPFLLLAAVPYFLLKQIKSTESRYYEDFLLFMVAMAWTFILLAKGISGFGGNIFGFLYDNVPLFWFFREPYAKFMPVYVLVGNMLLVYSLIKIQHIFSSKKLFILIFQVALIVCAIFLGYPFWTSKVINGDSSEDSISPTVKIPDYWQSLRKNWTPKPGYYVLYPTLGVTDYFNWPSGYVGNPYILLKDLNIISSKTLIFANSGLDNVTSYVYRAIFESPDKFKDIASTYKISGLIIQEDTRYDALSGTVRRLKTKYANQPKIDAEKIGIYELETPASDVSILPSERVYKSSQLTAKDYVYIKQIYGTDVMFSYTQENPQDLYLLEPVGAKDDGKLLQLTYDLSKIPDAAYFGHILNIAPKTINAVKTDGKNIAFTDPLRINFDGTCCGLLEVTSNDAKSPKHIPLSWQYSDKDKLIGDTPIQKNLPSLNFSAPNAMYYVRIPEFELSKNYEFGVDFGTHIPFDVLVSIVQHDIETNAEVLYGDAIISKGIEAIHFSYVSETVLNALDTQEYFLRFKPYIDVQNNGFRAGAVPIKALAYKDITQDKLILIKDKKADPNTKELPRIENYERVTQSLAILELQNLNDEVSYLQFKDAYDPNWALIAISQSEYELLRSPGIIKDLYAVKYLLSEKNSTTHVNIESYSNGWELENISGRHFAIIFWPNIVSSALFICSVALAGVLFVYILFKRKNND